MLPSYAELHCLTNFSFLRGASHPEELVHSAMQLGYSALAVTDECSLAGVVRAHVAAKDSGLKLIIGAEIRLEANGPKTGPRTEDRGPKTGPSAEGRVPSEPRSRFFNRQPPVSAVAPSTDFQHSALGTGSSSHPHPGPPLEREEDESRDPRYGFAPGAQHPAPSTDLRLVLLATDREGYGNLSELITRGRRQAKKGTYQLLRSDLERGLPGCLALLLPGEQPRLDDARWLAERFSGDAWIAAELLRGPDDRAYLQSLRQLSGSSGLRLIAAGDVHMHIRERRALQDTLTAIRLRQPIHQCGHALFPNGERHPRSREALKDIYPPELLAETLRVAERCTFDLSSLRYEYPEEIVPAGETPASWLRKLAEEGFRWRFGSELKTGPRGKQKDSAECWVLSAECKNQGGGSLSPSWERVGERGLSKEAAKQAHKQLPPSPSPLPPRGEGRKTQESKIGPSAAGRGPGESRSRFFNRQLPASAVAPSTRHPAPGTDSAPNPVPDFHSALGLQPSALVSGWGGHFTVGHDADIDKARVLVEHELALIAELEYEPYFLTVYDIVRFARNKGILCQGRGSAANSALCYCLGITEVDPARMQMLFERFISKERNEPPDIDVDFEHERREEVIQYIYDKYGRERAALAATVISYRPKSALRDVGKALGLDLSQVDRLSKGLAWWDGRRVRPERLREAGFDPDSRMIRQLTELVDIIVGFPRHLSQHVGGFVISRGLLSRLVPIENAAMKDRTVIQWDKDDLDALRLLKVDVLALGMLTAIRRALDLVSGTRGTPFTMADVPPEDPGVYEMVGHADTVGVFQIESRAQQSMLPRMRPACFYDLVIEVAIVRPGPIQGGMVHPYLRRRQKLEAVSYPSEKVKQVLERTLGVPIFQEQVMQLAVVAAGFTPGEADRLRRAMAAWKRRGGLEPFEQKLKDGMRKNGYEPEFADQIYRQILGFGEYGFPESHSASFALLVYVSSWLKRYEPAAFTCALLNSQPMGFYAPAQLVQDAQRHGVEVRPPDVLMSEWECTLENSAECWVLGAECGKQGPRAEGQGLSEPRSRFFNRQAPASAVAPSTDLSHSALSTDFSTRAGERGPAIRLGLCMVKGLSKEAGLRLVEARKRLTGPGAEDRGPSEKPSAECWVLSAECSNRSRRLSVEEPRTRFTRPSALEFFAPGTDFQHPALSTDFSFESLAHAARLDRRDMNALAAAGALASIVGHRRQAAWEVTGVEPRPPILQGAPIHETTPELIAPSEGEDLVADYASLGLTLGRHPMALLRSRLDAMRMSTADEIKQLPHGKLARAAGIVIGRQRPDTASGVIFVTLEDETGTINVVVWQGVAQRQRRALLGSRLMAVHGVIEREGEVVHLVAGQLVDHSALLGRLTTRSRDFH